MQEKRRAAGLTQKEVADALNYTTAQFISNWERGVSIPPGEALQVLSKLFSVRYRELVDLIYRYHELAIRIDRKELLAMHKAG